MEIREYIDTLDIPEKFKAFLYDEYRFSSVDEFKDIWEECIIDHDEIVTPDHHYGVIVYSEKEAEQAVCSYYEMMIDDLKYVSKHMYDSIIDYINIERLCNETGFDELYDAWEVTWNNEMYWCHDS